MSELGVIRRNCRAPDFQQSSTDTYAWIVLRHQFELDGFEFVRAGIRFLGDGKVFTVLLHDTHACGDAAWSEARWLLETLGFSRYSDQPPTPQPTTPG